MSAVSDLQAVEAQIAQSQTAMAANIVTLGSSVQAAITLLQGFQNGTVNADDPAVEAVVAKLQGDFTAMQDSNTTVGNAASQLTAAVAPVASPSATAAAQAGVATPAPSPNAPVTTTSSS